MHWYHCIAPPGVAAAARRARAAALDGRGAGGHTRLEYVRYEDILVSASKPDLRFRRLILYWLAARMHPAILPAAPSGDGAAISGVHRHVGLLQERPGGIGAATSDIEIFPSKCQKQ